MEYQFHPVAGGIVRFKVRAAHDAHLALTTGPQESDPMIEVFIGGWSNAKSVIRKNRTKPDVVEVDTPGILAAGEFRGFWIRWTHDGIITVGREDEVAAFMSWEDPDRVPFQFVGVCTGWGATGSWQIEGKTRATNLLIKSFVCNPRFANLFNCPFAMLLHPPFSLYDFFGTPDFISIYPPSPGFACPASASYRRKGNPDGRLPHL